ncbi:MAG: hypothetical protein ABJM29_09165 [Rhizobiaceae bacterium]
MIAYYCVEDPLSRSAMVRLVGDLVNDADLTELQPNQGGYGPIKSKLKAYCQLANHHPVYLQTDLDRVECAPSLKRNWIDGAGLVEPLPENLIFNIAVTEVEGWLLADRHNFSAFLGVSAARLPLNAEIDDPKEFLINCVRTHGNRSAKTNILPTGNSKVGTGYNSFLCDFVETSWDFRSASEHNASLERAIIRISETG